MLTGIPPEFLVHPSLRDLEGLYSDEMLLSIAAILAEQAEAMKRGT